MLIDATVYPANSTYVTNIVNMTKTILNMADTNCAHLQCPLYHSQTVPPALLKHQRTLEDSLVAGGCDVMSRVSLHFDKSHGSCVRHSHGSATLPGSDFQQFRNESLEGEFCFPEMLNWTGASHSRQWHDRVWFGDSLGSLCPSRTDSGLCILFFIFFWSTSYRWW